MPRWYCLMLKGMALGENVRTMLYREACRMIANYSRRAKITDNCFEGELRTSFATMSVGSLFGIHFTGTIETEQGKTEISFLVDNTDFEEAAEQGTWGTYTIVFDASEPRPVTVH